MKCFWRQQAASLTVEVSGVDLQRRKGSSLHGLRLRLENRCIATLGDANP